MPVDQKVCRNAAAFTEYYSVKNSLPLTLRWRGSRNPQTALLLVVFCLRSVIVLYVTFLIYHCYF